MHRGELGEAEALFQETMSQYRDQAITLGKAECLVGFAALSAARDDAERGARLLGAVDAAQLTLGVELHAGDLFERERTLRTLHTLLSETAFAAAWADGRAMTLDRAVSYALKQQGD